MIWHRVRSVVWKLMKSTVAEWRADKVPRLGAALAFYSILSLAPLLLLMLAAAGALFGAEAARGQITAQLHELLGTGGAAAIEGIIKASAAHKSEGIIATLVGLATLLIGASGVFGQLQDALNTIWHVKPPPGRGIMNFIKNQLLAFVMVAGTGVLLIASLAISTALSAIAKYATDISPQFTILFSVINFFISFAVIAALFAMIFKILPNIAITWRDVCVGAALTTELFIIGKFLIGLYLSHSSVSSSYGAAGSVMVVLIWVYYSAQILLFGAEFTKVYAKMFGSHQSA